MKRVSLTDLRAFSESALIKAGLKPENAATVADVLITTDMFGVLSHGTKNLCGYIQKMQAGGLNATAEPTVEAEGPSFALINGNDAIGMLSSCRAMELAIKKASETGIAYVGVKNSCHFGAAGYYANMAAMRGMIGLSMSNGDPIMTVPGGKGVAIGNNPFSFAAPLGDGRSVFLDIALSSVAALKVVMAKEKGAEVPSGWLVDSNGNPTTDPSSFPGGSSLTPMAAHKGYGFAVMVEILAAILTGAGFLSQIGSWNLDLESKNKVGHAFIAIDISKLIGRDIFDARMARLADELHNSPKASGSSRIFLPGEPDWEKREIAEKNGSIEITDVMAENYAKLGEMFGLKINIIND